MHSAEVYFGGPDRAPGRLRDLLAERVRAVPAGGAIDWVTYYFRDRRLAADLVAAAGRGVHVRLTLEGRPRTPRANDSALALLGDLGDDLRVVGRSPGTVRFELPGRPRLHEKLYCFSHPQPEALVGSFNPSGDEPEQHPDVIREIGDQDRGYNNLVSLRDPALVDSLVRHARRLHCARHGVSDRFRGPENGRIVCGDTALYFWPRTRPDPVNRLLRGFGAGTRVRIASSHLKGRAAERALVGLVNRGAVVEVLAEHTARRVPPRTEARLRSAGVLIRRVVHQGGVPMHSKFALVDAPGERWVVFGSFNWTTRSRRFNREIGVLSRNDTRLYEAFDAHWRTLSAPSAAHQREKVCPKPRRRRPK